MAGSKEIGVLMIDFRDHEDRLDIEIYELIHYGQEGSYWDFKREWYKLGDDNSDQKKRAKEALLLDVLCMANNPDCRDAYIVIGVDNETREVLGTEGDPNRRDTEKLIDLLRARRFAGGTLPKIRVESVAIGRKMDVIVIESTRDVPYMLAEDCGKIRAGVVYSRDGSTNTPVNKGASEHAIAKLWQRRFYLDAPPYERLLYMLTRKDKWVAVQTPGPDKYYLEDAPEYTVEMDYSEYEFESRKNIVPEFYFFTQADPSPAYAHCVAKYHNTVLLRVNVAILDGGRYTSPVPKWGNVDFYGDLGRELAESTAYGYFVEGSPEWLLHAFLYDHRSGSEETARRRLMMAIPVFVDDHEREAFEEYVRANELLEDAVKQEEAYVPDTYGEYAQRNFTRQLKVTRALKQLLKEWRYRESDVK